MRRRIARGLTLALFVGLGAAQGPTSSGSIPHQERIAKATRIDHSLFQWLGIRPTRPYQIGTASWYGEDFAGKPTASGEPYDMYDLTAAHPTLPLGTLVKVTNLENRRSVVVRINDRGPIVPGRIIDVSYIAAQVLKFRKRGIQQVRLDLIFSPKPVVMMAMLHRPVLGQ
jgi:rare lipoprotein A (peptidoglycan hydrolase)